MADTQPCPLPADEAGPQRSGPTLSCRTPPGHFASPPVSPRLGHWLSSMRLGARTPAISLAQSHAHTLITRLRMAYDAHSVT